jgi:hypothetical protein
MGLLRKYLRRGLVERVSNDDNTTVIRFKKIKSAKLKHAKKKRLNKQRASVPKPIGSYLEAEPKKSYLQRRAEKKAAAAAVPIDTSAAPVETPINITSTVDAAPVENAPQEIQKQPQ